MSDVTCNGKPVLGLRLTLPHVGIWVACLEVDADDAIAGAVTIKDDETSYVGTVVRSGVVAGTCAIEAVGGSGGFAGNVTARSYQGVTARAVLADILAACKERLDPTAQAGLLSRALPYWTRPVTKGSTAVAELVAALGARWRVLPGGGVWVGKDTWKAVPKALETAAIELDRDDAAGTVLVAPDSLALGPGVTLAGRKVGRVEHSFGREQPMRTTYWAATS